MVCPEPGTLNRMDRLNVAVSGQGRGGSDPWEQSELRQFSVNNRHRLDVRICRFRSLHPKLGVLLVGS